MIKNRLQPEWVLFLTAVMFLTRIPVRLEYSDANLNRSARYFPLVGLIVGLVTASVLGLVSPVFGLPVSILLSMIVGFMLTGALHEDGFADSCDALGGGWSKDEVLSILKDSRLGSYGVIGLVSLLGLKWNTLVELEYSTLIPALVCAHSLSRGLAVSYLYDMDYVQDPGNSKSRPLATRMNNFDFRIMLVTAVLPALIWLQLKVIPLLMVLYLVRCGWKRYLIHRIGGYTGDTLGASQQLFEIGFYLYLCALA